MQKAVKIRDERGLGKQIKRVTPARLFRAFTVVYNAIMRQLPFGLKYAIARVFRKHRAPYRFLRPEDTVVQIGSARDILHAGRSRAVHLSFCVPRGRVIVVEADHGNCDALREVKDRRGLGNLTVVECGAWSESSELVFLSSPTHPAANLLVEAKELSEQVVNARRYAKQTIKVEALDSILEGLGVTAARLVSITTNGSELKILEGMKKVMSNGCEYISLASTGPGFHEHMASLGYEYIVRDDRGYCFRKSSG